MQIINPLYDKAFKYLMQNNRLAKKVLSVILDQQIEKLKLTQQETVVPDLKRQLTLFRLDFKADIRLESGGTQTVLIELQKSKFDTDIKRFRNYLGASYMSQVNKQSKEAKGDASVYPIITIYILGYNLEDVPYLAVNVDRKIVNSVNKEDIQLNSFFINHLTHRTHILQVKRLPKERKTRLEKFLTIFNQAWCTEKKYIIDLLDTPKEFEDIVLHLQKPVLDPKFRRQLEGEEEIDLIFDKQEAEFQKKMAKIKQEKEQVEKEKARAEEEKEWAENEKKLAEIEKMKTQEYLEKVKGEKEQADATIRNAILAMYNNKVEISFIAASFSLSVEEVKEILDRK